MKNLVLLSLIAFAWPSLSHAQYFSIFGVKKNLKLSNKAPSYKDYYIDAGSEEGVRREMIVDVVRRMPIHDGFKNQAKGDLLLTVGKLKIIHVEKNTAVARYYNMTDDKGRPIIDFNTIMIGDEIDISTAVVEVMEEEERAPAKKATREKKRVPSSPPPSSEMPKKAKQTARAPLPPLQQPFVGPPIL